MNKQMLIALLRKDLILYFSNRFFAFITVLALVFYTVIYFFLLPADIDETLEMALFAPNLPVQFTNQLEEGGVVLARMESVEALQTAVLSGDYEVGIALPDNFAQNLAAGGAETARVYFNANFPDEFKELYIAFLDELGFMFSGRPLNIEVTEEILGVDRAGNQIPFRDRMLPLFAVFILMMEMMGLASLITNEVESGTLSALLVTPLRIEGLFLAKGIFGVGLAFVQVVLLMIITGGLNQQPFLILSALLIGSIMVTGLGFLIASVARDLMSVMGWSMLGILLLALPALSMLVPGLTTNWVKTIPSFYLVNTVYQVTNYGWGWADAGQDLLALLLFATLFLGLGVFVLRRRFQ
ncbi:MAG: ABC transporter permease [Anaerolinea sp.]|nr:ABC transporter permease [Anaerolinea sp.]